MNILVDPYMPSIFPLKISSFWCPTFEDRFKHQSVTHLRKASVLPPTTKSRQQWTVYSETQICCIMLMRWTLNFVSVIFESLAFSLIFLAVNLLCELLTLLGSFCEDSWVKGVCIVIKCFASPHIFCSCIHLKDYNWPAGPSLHKRKWLACQCPFPTLFVLALSAFCLLKKEKQEKPHWMDHSLIHSVQSVLSPSAPTTDSTHQVGRMSAVKGPTVVLNIVEIGGHRWSIIAQQHLMADCGLESGAWCLLIFYKIFGCILLSKLWTKAFALRGFYSFSWNLGYEELYMRSTGTIPVVSWLDTFFPFPMTHPPVSFLLIPLFHMCTGMFPLHMPALERPVSWKRDKCTGMTADESALILLMSYLCPITKWEDSFIGAASTTSELF